MYRVYEYKDIFYINDPKPYYAIGQKVYFGSSEEGVLNSANTQDYDHWGTFIGIMDDVFQIKEDNQGWEYIILCDSQEFEGEYIPFESKCDFIDHYYDIFEKYVDGKVNPPGDFKLMKWGMFIQEKYSTSVYQVLEISEFGISILERNSLLVTWHNLLEKYEFLDGSKCGKLYEKE